MTRRLENALLYRQHLLNTKEGMTTLRHLQTSLALSSIGVRMMWEYRNEKKWAIIAEYLATFRDYDIQTDAQQSEQNKKYIEFCIKKRTMAVQTELPADDGLDLLQPTSRWFSTRPCISPGFDEDDVDWGDNDMTRQGADFVEGHAALEDLDMDMDPSEEPLGEQQVCKQKTKPEQAQVEKKFDVDSRPQQQQVDSKKVAPQRAYTGPMSVFTHKVCKMDVDSGGPIFEQVAAEESKAETPIKK